MQLGVNDSYLHDYLSDISFKFTIFLYISSNKVLTTSVTIYLQITMYMLLIYSLHQTSLFWEFEGLFQICEVRMLPKKIE